MSGRMVPQFALAGLLAAALASSSSAQFDPVPGVYGGSRVDASSPEVAPMPRVKGAAAIEFEYSIIPAGGVVVHPLVVPPPPRCAFDCQLNPVPAVPCMNQDTLVRVKETHTGSFVVSGGVNSDAGLSGNVIVNERNFDLHCPTGPVVSGMGVMKFEWIQSNPAETVPQLPRKLVELVGEFVCENNGDLRLVRFKAPAGAAMRQSGQSYPYPVRGLTTIRWDESGGGWWVETVRVPQPWDMPTQNGKFEHAESSWNTTSDRLEDNRTCGTPTTTTVTVVPAPCSTKTGKLTGTWVREMEGAVIAATMSGDELKICLNQSAEGVTLCVTLIADCTLTKEGLVHGVITGFDIDLKRDPKAGNSPPSTPEFNDTQLASTLQDLVDCPFSFRTRMTSVGLMVSNVKIASLPDAAPKELLALLGGMYKFSKDSSVPVPKPRTSARSLSGNVSPVADGATGTDVLVGGGIGAGPGALLGAVCHQPLADAAIGGLVGAGTGAAIGQNVDQQACQANQQATAAAIAQAQAQAKLIQPVDVVHWTRIGSDEKIIIDQLQIFGCTPLDPSNLQYLQQNGVSLRVIAAMQAAAARSTAPIVAGPPPVVYVAPPPVYYGYGYRRWGGYPDTGYCPAIPSPASSPSAPPPVPMTPPPAPLSYPRPNATQGFYEPGFNIELGCKTAEGVTIYANYKQLMESVYSPGASTMPPDLAPAQVQSQRASDANFIEQYYKSERDTMPTPQPANVPAPAFDALADAFGQMLNAKQMPSVVVSSPQACPLCPVPPTCTMQATSVVLPPCAAVVPVTNTGPVGTWVRVVGPMVYAIRITPDHIIVTASSATGISDDQVVTESTILTADYHMMRDGTTMVGLITSFDVRLDGDVPEDADFDEIAGQLSHIQKAVTDKPFALSVRVYGNALAIGNVRLPEVESPDAWSPMTVLGGRYSAAGDKPLPKPKVMKAPMPPQGFPPPPPVYGYPTGIIGAPTGLPGLPPPGIPQGAMPPPAAQGCFPAGSGTVIRVITQNPGCGAAGQPGCPLTPPGGVISGCGGVMIPPPPTVQFGLVPTPIPGTGSPTMIPPPPVDLAVPMMPEPTPPATVEAPVTAKKSKKKQPSQ